MDVLILGGTQFVGRAITEAALAAGHHVTLFNRGKTNTDLFPNVEKLIGNRDGDLSALEGRQWDVAVDVSGYLPRIVHASAELLADAVEHYTFISTVAVYDHSVYSKAGTTEDGPLATLEDESTETINAETYGALKVLCEQAAEDAMPGRVLNVRCGLIVGPHDHTDRFTYWPVNTARGGEILAPPADALSQVIDVRDLAQWIINMAEARNSGVFTATGPDYQLTYGRILEACQTAAGGDTARVVHAYEDFLIENDVREWTELPLWLPASHNGMAQLDVSKAIAAGLTFRLIEETVADTLAWYKDESGLGSPLKAGMDPEREAELLEKWHATH